jgi:hypothetical protein
MAGEKLGITLSDRNRIKIIKADSPCARTGIIMAGDEIIGVDGVSVEGNRDECLRQLKESGPKIEFRLRRRSPPDAASPPPIAKPGAPAIPAANPAMFLPNKAEIAALDVAGVGALLAKLKLDIHIGIFEENVITGKVFLGLDDDTLMSDLAVVRQASFVSLHGCFNVSLICGEPDPRQSVRVLVGVYLHLTRHFGCPGRRRLRLVFQIRKLDRLKILQ